MHIKKVAKIAKVSVRTLQYYDEIGLLVPTRNKWNDYRDYSESDISKLQQICFFKTCGFTLTKIRDLLNSSSFDRRQAFDLQKTYLLQEKERIEVLLDTLERSIQEMTGDSSMTVAEKFNGFDFTKENAYAQEVRERWGDGAIEKTQAKLHSLDNSGKQNLSFKLTDFFTNLARLIDESPKSDQVQKEIDNLYQSFNEDLGYHYTLAAFAGVGALYISDMRFHDNLNQYADGFPEFLSAAISVYTAIRSL